MQVLHLHAFLWISELLEEEMYRWVVPFQQIERLENTVADRQYQLSLKQSDAFISLKCDKDCDFVLVLNLTLNMLVPKGEDQFEEVY